MSCNYYLQYFYSTDSVLEKLRKKAMNRGEEPTPCRLPLLTTENEKEGASKLLGNLPSHEQHRGGRMEPLSKENRDDAQRTCRERAYPRR